MRLPIARRSALEARVRELHEARAERNTLAAAIEAHLKARDEAETSAALALGDRDRIARAHARSEAESRAARAAQDRSEAELHRAMERLDAAIAAHATLVAGLESALAARAQLSTTLEASLAARDTLARELDAVRTRLRDIEAETDRLGRDTLRLTADLAARDHDLAVARAAHERAAARQLDFEQEAARLGAETMRLEAEKRAWLEERNALYARVHGLETAAAVQARQLDLARARDPLLVGTFPRSGTWMLKYFLQILDHYTAGGDAFDIRDIHNRIMAAPEFLLHFGQTSRRAQHIAISHWMCPGVFALPARRTARLGDLLGRLGALDYARDNDEAHAGFAPQNGSGQIVFVYRNPLDVYRSYADIYERRMALADRKPYPFNPMAPWGTALMNSVSDRPFEHFIDGFAESGFSEFFAAYFLSFLLVRDAHPERVLFLRYEDAIADRRRYLASIVRHGRLGDLDDPAFAAAFDRAVQATEMDAMKGYETALGHALSGAATFYGEANATHLSVKPRRLDTIFGEDHKAELRRRIAAIEPRILAFLPELAETPAAIGRDAPVVAQQSGVEGSG